MARHPFDPVSFVLGGVAVASGAVVLADRSLTDDARVLLPAGLIALGIALFTKVVRNDGRPIPADPAPVPPPVPSAVDLPGPGPTPTDHDPYPQDAPWPTSGATPGVPPPAEPAEATDIATDAPDGDTTASDAPDGDPTASDAPGDGTEAAAGEDPTSP